MSRAAQEALWRLGGRMCFSCFERIPRLGSPADVHREHACDRCDIEGMLCDACLYRTGDGMHGSVLCFEHAP